MDAGQFQVFFNIILSKKACIGRLYTALPSRPFTNQAQSRPSPVQCVLRPV